MAGSEGSCFTTTTVVLFSSYSFVLLIVLSRYKIKPLVAVVAVRKSNFFLILKGVREKSPVSRRLVR